MDKDYDSDGGHSPEMDKVINRVIDRTTVIEEQLMFEGVNEVMPVMTPEEFEAFINAEDEALKEERGDVPVIEQLEDGQSES